MVSVGGFLGVGDREVRIAWSTQDHRQRREGHGQHDQDELKAKPEYKYKNETWRGQVFTGTGPWAARPSDTARAAPDAPRPASDQLAQTTKPPADRSTDKPADRPNVAATTSTGDFNAAGEMSGNALIGATVRNENREAVGKVEDVYVDNSGASRPWSCRSAASSASAPRTSR